SCQGALLLLAGGRQKTLFTVPSRSLSHGPAIRSGDRRRLSIGPIIGSRRLRPAVLAHHETFLQQPFGEGDPLLVLQIAGDFADRIGGTPQGKRQSLAEKRR